MEHKKDSKIPCFCSTCNEVFVSRWTKDQHNRHPAAIPEDPIIFHTQKRNLLDHDAYSTSEEESEMAIHTVSHSAQTC